MSYSFILETQKKITHSGHGSYVSDYQIDSLDKQSLNYAANRAVHTKNIGLCIDIGAGLGTQGIRFAALGYSTLLIDQHFVDQKIFELVTMAGLPLSYMAVDARNLKASDIPGRIEICYSQRFIHYLRFKEAIVLLKLIRSKMHPGARLFISASGLHSELGHEYLGKSHDIQNRFSCLSSFMAERHNIYTPVCLYTPEELIQLCHQTRFYCEKVYYSTSFNVKGVFIAA